MASSRLNPYLYTYCSLPTLQAMVENGTLRFSDIRKSNDAKELVYGFNQVKKRLQTLVDDDRELMALRKKALKSGAVQEGCDPWTIEPVNDESAPLCDAFNVRLYAYFLRHYFDEEDMISEEDFLEVCEHVINLLGRIARAMKRERRGKPYDDETAQILIPRCLTLCFTGNGDLLSQWRGYGDDGRGVAVGFYREDINRLVSWWDRFKTLPENSSIHLNHGAVFYREKDDSFTSITISSMRHRPFMEERWELARDNMLRSDEIWQCDMMLFAMLHGFLRDGVTKEPSLPDIQRSLNRVFNVCKQFVPLFKQPLFYEEEEERLFLWMEGGSKVEGLDPYISQTPSRRVSNDGFASYLDICVLKSSGKPGAGGTVNPALLQSVPTVEIGEIVLGPRCVASEHDMVALFADYPSLPKLVRSRIPYA